MTIRFTNTRAIFRCDYIDGGVACSETSWVEPPRLDRPHLDWRVIVADGLRDLHQCPKHAAIDLRRASGDSVCRCGREYWKHPDDRLTLSYDGTPFLRVLCDGTRVKL